MFKLFPLILFFSIFTSMDAVEPIHLLTTPSEIEISEVDQFKPILLGSWISTGRVSTFFHQDGATYLSVEYWGELPAELEQYADRFRAEEKETVEGKAFTAYIYEYGNLDMAQKSEFQVSFDGKDYQWAHVGSFAYREHRHFDAETTPTKISTEDLFDIINKKKVVFYTGVGLAKVSGVPTREDFVDMLGRDGSLLVDQMILGAIQNPEIQIAILKNVCETLENAQPSKTHVALAAFANSKGCQILSDNDDLVMERTGTRPVKLYADKRLDKRVSLESLQDVEVVICLGLGRDNLGLLTLFKELNPDGKIIAVDIFQPEYLGDEDMFLQGDLSVVFPSYID